MLKREYLALHKLSHPNIVKIYGICIDDTEWVALMMELVVGGSLRGLLDEKTDAPVAESPHAQFTLLRGIVGGMAYLHERSILHHDLKSDNVLVGRGGQGDSDLVAKIADFGLASGGRYLGLEALWRRRTRVPPSSPSASAHASSRALLSVASARVPWQRVDEL